MTIQAIETRYKGYRFRSRLEARWAVFFDALGILWEYETEGYALSIDWAEYIADIPRSHFTYLPDFWLPQVEMYAEVKPGDPTKEEFFKACALAEMTASPVLFLTGMPAARMYWAVEGREYNHGAFDFSLAQFDIQDAHRYWLCEKRFYRHDSDSIECLDFRFPKYVERIDGDQRAIAAARAARFEFGDSP